MDMYIFVPLFVCMCACVCVSLSVFDHKLKHGFSAALWPVFKLQMIEFVSNLSERNATMTQFICESVYLSLLKYSNLMYRGQ